MTLIDTGRTADFSLVGMFIALDGDGDPVMVALESEPGILLMPVFDSLQELRLVMTTAGASWEREVQIVDHDGVVAWFQGLAACAALDGDDVRLVSNLHRTPEGGTRFMQLMIPKAVEA